ncbi:MAG: hypothetical protein CL833_07385 [Crocinitomicaceae bacterium]|jgi:hypothetical protein|nr:hypothetical protein [Crocinitomicaceae bacterium]
MMKMNKTYTKEDLSATDLNEWGYPNANYKYIGNSLFKMRDVEDNDLVRDDEDDEVTNEN